MESKKFRNRFFYMVCHSAINLSKKTKFSSFNGFCEYIKNNLENAPQEKESTKVVGYIYAIVDEINIIYGLPEQKVAKLVVEFFMNSEWKNYVTLAYKIKRHFNV